MALVHCMSFDSSTAIADFASEFTIMQGLSIGTVGPSGANYLISGPTSAGSRTNRYWRVNITANADNNNPIIETITMATAAGGTNLITQQASCSAQTSYSASYGPGLVVVGVAGQWSANGGPSQWWQYDLGVGNSASVNNFTFTASAGWAGRAPTAFTIQSSSDGVTFFDEWSGTFSAWVDTDTKSTTNPTYVPAAASTDKWNMRQVFSPFAAAAQGFIGARIRPSSTAACLFGVTDSASNPQFFVQIAANGQPILYQATGTAAAFGFGTAFYTGTVGQIPPGVFSYVEIGFVVSATVGTLTLRINGSVVFTVSGVNTRGTGAGPEVAAYLLYGSASILDVIVADATGLAPSNTFFGDVRVYEVVPTGPGSVTQFTPTGAATDWQAAAVSPPTDATVYNSASAVNLSDRYAHAVIPPTLNVIYGVRVKARAQKTSTVARSISLNINSGASTAAGTPHPLSLTPVVYADVFTVDPATGLGFTPAGVNALQFGPTVIV